MKLYELGPTRSIRARWTLQELGVAFESEKVDLTQGENQRPEFLRVNPAAKLPVLEDDGMVLTESAAIVVYLAEKYPKAGLLPTDLQTRAQMHRWLMFTVTEIEQPLWRMAKHTGIYPEEKRSPADVRLAREDIKPMLTVLDRHLSGRQFVAGDSVTVADFVLAYTLDWANEEQLLGDFPILEQYMERMYRRPNAPVRIAQALAELRAS